jgi:flagellar hook-associated protein 1 FlgK
MLTSMDLLRIGETGLIAHKARMAVTSHNVVNVNTPGYHRQRVKLTTQPPVDNSGLSTFRYAFGTGVKIAAIVRDYDILRENSLRASMGNASYFSQLAESLKDLEGLAAGNGQSNLTTRLQEFWASWQDLANNADSYAHRSALLQSARALSAQINNLHSQMSNYRAGMLSGALAGTSGSIANEIEDINSLAVEIADLNHTIFLAKSRGSDVNDLMDRRDAAVLELSQKTSLTLVREDDSTYTITVDGQDLVRQYQANAITITSDNPPSFELDGAAITITNGRVAALTTAMSRADTFLTDMDTLAASLITEVNALHLQGYDLYGLHASNDYDPDHIFFSGTGAADIAVDTAILADPALIAAAATRHADGPPPVPNEGDGAQALAIADLCAVRIPALTNRTMAQFYLDRISDLGAEANAAADMADNGQAVVDMLQQSILSDTGVSLDEEMVELLSAQRAFQASARVVQMADGILDVIINQIGA